MTARTSVRRVDPRGHRTSRQRTKLLDPYLGFLAPGYPMYWWRRGKYDRRALKARKAQRKRIAVLWRADVLLVSLAILAALMYSGWLVAIVRFLQDRL
jgi:hypothetical protein